MKQRAKTRKLTPSGCPTKSTSPATPRAAASASRARPRLASQLIQLAMLSGGCEGTVNGHVPQATVACHGGYWPGRCQRRDVRIAARPFILRTVGTVLLVAGVFIYMVVFVVGTGWVAERKGYSFGLFIALGLFLGIIGLIIALVVPRKR